MFSALKGGGNNFGIVSRFRLATFEQKDLFTSIKSYEESRLESLFNAITYFNVEASNDPAASAVLSIAYLGFGKLTAAVAMVHASNRTNTPLFEKFETIPSIGGESKSMRMLEMAKWMDESNPSGYR